VLMITTGRSSLGPAAVSRWGHVPHRAVCCCALPTRPTQPPPFAGGGGSFRGEALVPARGRHVTPQAMNNRRGWEDEASSRAVNAQPWEPPPGMVKLQCSDCHYWFAAPHHDVERCPDCEIREQRRAARAAALAEADRVLAEAPH
jgi:hypothetical protein